MRRSVTFCAVLALSSAAFGPIHSEASAPSADPTTSFTLPFDLVDNRVFIEVRLNGRGPFHLLLDTGTGGVTISAAVAQQLGLHVADAGEGQGVGEKVMRAGQAQIAQVQIGDLALADLDSRLMDLSDGPQVFGTKPFDGIIGLPVFERMVVKHDYVKRVLTFTAPDRFAYAGAGVIVHFERPRQIPVVAASLDGVQGNFGVDTGARSSLLLYGPFCAQNNLQEKYGAKLEGVTGWGIGDPVRSLLARAKELQIGDVTVRDLVIRLSAQKTGLTTSSAMAGLIGPDVLSQFDITFDYARTRIIFEKNRNYGRRDSYDRAGIWMGPSQDAKHFTVVDVIAEGPGADAGVKSGDQILAINGESTANLILPDVRETIRREAVGAKLTLLLESDGKQRTAVVILKDLVSATGSSALSPLSRVRRSTGVNHALSLERMQCGRLALETLPFQTDMPLTKSVPLNPHGLTGIVMALCSVFAACHHPTDRNFVVVRIYRDSNSNFGRDLDRKLYGFNNFNNRLRLRSGKVIEVATMEGDYQEALAGKIASVKPQIIILDSPADAKRLHGAPFDLETAKNACGAEGNCLAYIPPWVDGEELEATNLVFLAVTKQ